MCAFLNKVPYNFDISKIVLSKVADILAKYDHNTLYQHEVQMLQRLLLNHWKKISKLWSENFSDRVVNSELIKSLIQKVVPHFMGYMTNRMFKSFRVVFYRDSTNMWISSLRNPNLCLQYLIQISLTPKRHESCGLNF